MTTRTPCPSCARRRQERDAARENAAVSQRLYDDHVARCGVEREQHAVTTHVHLAKLDELRASLASASRERDEALARLNDIAAQLFCNLPIYSGERDIVGLVSEVVRERDEATESLAIERRAFATQLARAEQRNAVLRERLSTTLTLLDEARGHVRDLSPVLRWDDVAREALVDPGAACLSSSAYDGDAVSGESPRATGEKA